MAWARDPAIAPSLSCIKLYFGAELHRYYLSAPPFLEELEEHIRSSFAYRFSADATIELHYRDDACDRIRVYCTDDLRLACSTEEAHATTMCRLYLTVPGVAAPAKWYVPPPLPREPMTLGLRDVSSFADLLSKFPASVDRSALRLHSCVDGGVRYRICSDADLNEFSKNQSRYESQLIVAYLARPLPAPKHRQRMDHLRVNTRLAVLLDEEDEGPRPQCVPATAHNAAAADSLSHDSDEEWSAEPDSPEELSWNQWWEAAAKHQRRVTLNSSSSSQSPLRKSAPRSLLRVRCSIHLTRSTSSV